MCKLVQVENRGNNYTLAGGASSEGKCYVGEGLSPPAAGAWGAETWRHHTHVEGSGLKRGIIPEAPWRQVARGPVRASECELTQQREPLTGWSRRITDNALFSPEEVLKEATFPSLAVSLSSLFFLLK